MSRIVIKNGYIKGGIKTKSKSGNDTKGGKAAHLSHLVKYIATREGVEKMESEQAIAKDMDSPVTAAQEKLIAEILHSLPESRKSFEYEDYINNPKFGNASEFIGISLEQHFDKVSDRSKYLDYVANRPRVEKIGSHGLFGISNEPIVLAQVAKEVSEHTGNVWTPIISLRRVDAEKTGFDNAAAWKALLSSKTFEIAGSLKIHPDRLRWYGAFHNEAHHPHVHLICYSTDDKEGYLTEQGIEKMKSAIANEIFKFEMVPMFAEKSVRRGNLQIAAKERLRELVQEMQSGALENPKIEQLVVYLSNRLKETKGKKQYGYLKPELKNVVDEIVDELAKDVRVAEAYSLWWQIKTGIDGIYTDNHPEMPQLSKCVDFKPIRNMVIQEAITACSGMVQTEEVVLADNAQETESLWEDAHQDFISENVIENEIQMEQKMQIEYEQRRKTVGHSLRNDDDIISSVPADDWHSKEKLSSAMESDGLHNWWTPDYKLAKQYLFGDEEAKIIKDFLQARTLLLREAETDNPLAMFDLGRMCADDLGCGVDAIESQLWYEKSLNKFRAAESANPWKYTEYRIGKMYAAGLGTGKDDKTAVYWLSQSADERYKYAEYSLARHCYYGKGTDRDITKAFHLYLDSAKQNFPYASFEVGRMLEQGIGCTKDIIESQKHYKDAFQGFCVLEKKSHDDKLQYRIGHMLSNGIGTEKNIIQAIDYYKKAASVGNSFAQYRLGLIFLKGDDVTKNVKAAIQYLTASASAGNEFAQYALGKLYLFGNDVPRDKETALMWLNLSAAQGNMYAQALIDHMSEINTPSVFVHAARLLHHMGRIFSEQPQLKTNALHQTESKLKRKLKEKKQAQGHAQDEHENTLSL